MKIFKLNLSLIFPMTNNPGIFEESYNFKSYAHVTEIMRIFQVKIFKINFFIKALTNSRNHKTDISMIPRKISESCTHQKIL